MCGNNLILKRGEIKNNDLVAKQIENGTWEISPRQYDDPKASFSFSQVEEIANLYDAAIVWYWDSFDKGIITPENVEKGTFADTMFNCEVDYHNFWDMVQFAKQHNLAKHSFPF